MSDKQKAQAAKLMASTRLAIEHATPKGTTYVCALVGPGFNTWAANIPAVDAIDLLKGLIQALERDVMQSGGMLKRDL